MNPLRDLRMLIWTFAGITAMLLGMCFLAPQTGVNILVLLIANTIFFITAVGAVRLQSAAMKQTNPNAFVRGISGGMLLKMMTVGIALFVYYFASGSTIDTSSIGWSLLFYPIYLILEVRTVLLINRKNHAPH
ncbi:MAG: hypothetical protein ACKO5C_05210 [Ferruginibacter sp.]